MQCFHDHRIHIVKEEGDASDTNQAYDQSVAKADKARIRGLLDTVRPSLGVMTQWDVIATCITALGRVTKTAWISSFQKVNLHPHHRVPIDEWLKRIDAKLQTGERFFKECNNELFDAMPAVWRNLPVEVRHKVVSIINEFIASTPTGESAWCSQNVRKLLRFCSLDDVPKIRASYMMSKIDPGVIVGTDSSKDPEALAAAAAKRAKMLEPFKMATMLPKPLLDEYKNNKNDSSVQSKLFNHTTNYVARHH